MRLEQRSLLFCTCVLIVFRLSLRPEIINHQSSQYTIQSDGYSSGLNFKPASFIFSPSAQFYGVGLSFFAQIGPNGRLAGGGDYFTLSVGSALFRKLTNKKNMSRMADG